MKFQHYITKGSKKLRCGYTTGSCAALASKASCEMLLSGRQIYETKIITPKGIEVNADIFEAEILEDSVKCGIRKDGGDDIDATDGMLIFSCIKLKPDKGILIKGGKGIGRVTKDGLDCAVGDWAINSTPRQMIIKELEELAKKYKYQGGFEVILEAPLGEEIAKKTFNPSLGVVGGISIIGTSGIVEPQSVQAIIDTIEIEFKMLSKKNIKSLILTPGNYGEAYIKSDNDLKDINRIKISNFIGEALDFSALYGFKNVLIVIHIGKGIKLAGGIMNTHSKYADCRKEIFTAYASLCGADNDTASKLMSSVTTDACIKILKEADLLENTMEKIIESAQVNIEHRAGENINLGIVMFSNVHGVLGKSIEGEGIIQMWKQGMK